MITSNISEYLLKNNQSSLNHKNVADTKDFIEEIKNTRTNKTDSFTYKNIKGISLKEIDTIFTSEDDKNMAKNLRLATLFTADSKLGQAMFNTVMGQKFETGYTFLQNRYEDKHNYFSSKSGNSLQTLLHKSIIDRSNSNKNNVDVISQELLDEILLEVESFSFLDTLLSTSKDQYGRYKNDDEYSYLYNNYTLQYEELIHKYKELTNTNNTILKQF